MRSSGNFEALRAKYLEKVPLAVHAKNPGQLVDRVVRFRLFKEPRRNYREVLVEVLDADPELAEAYNQ